MKLFSRTIIIIFFTFFCIFNTAVYATADPREVPNNKYGIHVVDPSDINGVTDLINSSGGEWGYVKVVIPESDRNSGKWDSVFRELRRKKLIPIVRIATQTQGSVWTKPTDQSIKDWPTFLNSLSWPTQNRYVILFNEPNHAKEWGGEIYPEEFGQKTVQLAKLLRQASPDYFILNAGLDASAGGDSESMDEEIFLKRVIDKNPEFLSILDGWNSHSYPNPGFSASPEKSGRGSLQTYLWEKSVLAQQGETRNLPVMVGETGWTHQEGEITNSQFLPTDTVASYYTIASQTVWKDPSIFAVIPFIYNYQGEPFAHFSFRKFGESGYHPQYFTYQAIPKTKGIPVQREAYQLLNNPLPEKLIAGSDYTLSLEVKNLGQAIVSPEDNYHIVFEEPTGLFTYQSEVLPIIEPDQTAKTILHLNTPFEPGEYAAKLSLKHNEQSFDLGYTAINVLPPPTLSLTAQLGWKKTSEASSASVLIYDGNNLIYEFDNLEVKNGIIITPGVLGIVPEQHYRIVTLIPNYLPRQVIAPINNQITFIQNNRFYPFDTNNNQHLDWGDIITLITSSPWQIIPRYIGG